MAKDLLVVVKSELKQKNVTMTGPQEGRWRRIERAFDAKQITLGEVMESFEDDFYKNFSKSDFDNLKRHLKSEIERKCL